MTAKVRRWTAAAVGVALLGGGVVAATSAQASPDLPARSAEQLLVDIQSPTTRTFSGTVQTTTDLGLPTLPTTQTGDTSGLTGLLTGTHTLRVWNDGDTRSRVSVIGNNAETSVIRSGADVWTYASADRSATHTRLTTPTTPQHPQPSGAATTPEQAAQQVLAAVGPSTSVTTRGASRVAGRPAYDLVFTPAAGEKTLVRSAQVAIDAETHLVLQVTVDAVDAKDHAVQIGFTSLTYATPDAKLFTFSAPSGTTVKEQPAPEASKQGQGGTSAEKPKVVGDGWDTVLVEKVGTLPADTSAQGQQAKQLLESLPRVSGSWGSGRLLQGTLFSAVLTDDGRLAVGAVPADQLFSALG
ncbi:LolA family protein [Raineyella fluvialis]|uniref:Outer membrane lipoprotein-sorting protein n=1 Tax=Raineyella fluvialis TaxID=2662261 RepID=A0A5Q2F802_9ACTN|nr:hypothetical protein [Raineyella fluvialis]QGF22959.1 hypothetical protein Rai3103_03955 [Raineyella fluvialis]